MKLDALRLLLRPFWDRSRAVVATRVAEFLAVHVCMLSQLTSDFLEISSKSKVGRTAGGVEGQLSSA